MRTIPNLPAALAVTGDLEDLASDSVRRLHAVQRIVEPWESGRLRDAESVAEELDAPMPAWVSATATMAPGALEEVSRTLTMGERSMHPVAFGDGLRDGHAAGYALGYAQGQADLSAQLLEAHRAYLEAENRAMASTADVPAYADLCERRGEHQRAERARALLAERGIA